MNSEHGLDLLVVIAAIVGSVIEFLSAAVEWVTGLGGYRRC